MDKPISFQDANKIQNQFFKISKQKINCTSNNKIQMTAMLCFYINLSYKEEFFTFLFRNLEYYLDEYKQYKPHSDDIPLFLDYKTPIYYHFSFSVG